jgi:hypothetical protein
MFDQTTDILLKIPASHAVVQACGSKIKILNNRIHTDCPECSSKMWIHNNSFVCENSMCRLKVSSPFEFLATSMFRKDVDKAVPYFQNLIDPKGKIIIDQRELSADLLLRRKLLQLFIDSALDPHDTFEDITINGWLRQQGIVIENIREIATVWSRNQLAKYESLTSDFGLKKIPYADYYLVIPYFTSPSTIGGVLITSPEMETPVRHTFSNKKYMWAGLLKNSVVSKEYLVTASFSNLLDLIGSNKMLITDQIPILSVYVNPSGFDYDFVPDRIHYLFDASSELLADTISYLAEDCEDFIVGNIMKCPTVDNALTWNEFLDRYIMAMISRSGINSAVLSFIDSCRLTGAQEYRLLNNLLLNGFHKENAKLKTHFSNKVIFLDNNTSVAQRAEGYVLSTGKSVKKVTQISNFTLEIERNVAYPDQKKVISEATANFKDQQLKVWIPLDGLETANTVEEAVRNAWIISDHAKQSDNSIPLIINKLDFRKYISPYTRNLAAKCPYSQGVSFLGWDFNKTKFQGPGWHIDENGIQQNDSILYPDSEFLNCYNPVKFSFDHSELLTVQDKKAIALIVGMIGRGFFDKLTNGIKCPEDINSNITDILYTLGQVKYLSPDTREIKISQNNGFPVGVINTSDFFRSKTISPVIDLDRNSNLGLVGNNKNYFYFLMNAVITGLIKKLIDAPTRFNSCDIATTLTQEGLHYVEQAIGERWDLAITLSEYDVLFSSMTKDDLKTKFKINPSRGVVTYRVSELPNLSIASAKEGDIGMIPLHDFTNKVYAYYEDNDIDFEYELSN